MPRSTQIIPEHLFPHQMVVINDNTEWLNVPSSESGNTYTLNIFASPKGKDGVMMTINNGAAGFLNEYGLGPFSVYGQPLLNAYITASTGAATMHCMRVAAPDSVYSSLHIVAKYKVEDEKVDVKFVAVPSAAPLTDLAVLGESYVPATAPDADGYSEVKLLSFAYVGRGSWGNNVRIRLTSNTAMDKENDYKNYTLEIYTNDGGLLRKEDFPVIFNEDAVISGVSKFSDAVVNEPKDGSELIELVTDVEGISKLYNVYKTANPDTIFEVEDFDPFFGINKYTREAIVNYSIDTTSDDIVVLNVLGGIPLIGGNDGVFSATTDPAVRKAAMTAEYIKAFSGQIDPMVKSKNKFPTNLILDANYDIEVKKLIASLATVRGDAITILDCGTGITTKNSPITYVKNNLDSYVSNRLQAIDAYAAKMKDPYSNKIITVTSTAWLAAMYPTSFQNNGAKHVPVAGNNFGVMGGFIQGSIYPIYDEDIDADVMDELVENNINFARLNAKQDVVRAIQETRQGINSSLSELNNMFILLDIKRDCERLCTTYEFNFSEPDDLARFNSMARDLLYSYSESQVRKIEARFDKNNFEAERGILHMYVEYVNKDLVKTTIIEIDVNRD